MIIRIIAIILSQRQLRGIASRLQPGLATGCSAASVHVFFSAKDGDFDQNIGCFKQKNVELSCMHNWDFYDT